MSNEHASLAPDRGCAVTTLKPCPFCGGEAEDGYHEAYSCDSSYSFIGCTKCEARIPYSDSSHCRETAGPNAIAAWNTRTPDPLSASAPALLEAAQRALNFIENTEGEFGITLDSGDALRAAISAATEAGK